MSEGAAHSSVVHSLAKRGAIKPEPFVSETVYEVVMGSEAYAVSSGGSDTDIYAVCIPPKTLVFPHLIGEIPGFGRQLKRFDVWQQHHIPKPGDPAKTYDISVYSIIKYFQLCMENNPNMLDSMFVPRRCILHMTPVGAIIRDNRKLFLSKKSWHTMKGYAYSQLHKATTKSPEPGSKRALDVQAKGYDSKFIYHVVRLLDEAEQILTTGDIDLERAREQLKAIRAGESSLEKITAYFTAKEKSLEEVYNTSKAVPYAPDEAAIKNVLLQCLEQTYGDLDRCIEAVGQDSTTLVKEIKELIKKKGF